MATKYTLEEVYEFAKKENREFLDDKYIKASYPHNWKCLICSFIFPQRLNNFLQGAGCPRCSGKARYTTEDCHRIAAEINRKFLDDKVINSQHPHNWKCLVCGYIFQQKINDISNGHTNCRRCIDRELYTIEDCHKIAKKYNRKFLDNECKGSAYPHSWLCNVCLFVFPQRINHVINGIGCPNCAGQVQYAIEDCHRIAELHNRKFLDTNYINNKEVHNWLCKRCNFIMEQSLNAILSGDGCPKCSNRLPITISEFNTLLFSKNIKLLDVGKVHKSVKPGRISNTTMVNLRCLFCHNEWNTKVKSIKIGKGCPKCNIGFGEKVCRFTLEFLLQKDFSKIKLNWMKGKSGKLLELDGYCKELGLAFEHNGLQHYEFVQDFHKNIDGFYAQQERDKLKQKYCLEGNIILLIFDNRKAVSFDKLVSIVKIELRNKRIEFIDQDITRSMFDAAFYLEKEKSLILQNMEDGLFMNIITEKENVINEMFYEFPEPENKLGEAGKSSQKE